MTDRDRVSGRVGADRQLVGGAHGLHQGVGAGAREVVGEPVKGHVASLRAHDGALRCQQATQSTVSG